MVNEKEIVRALQTIQQVCRENYECSDCPFLIDGLNIRKCGISENDPDHWRINTHSEWKAFKE